MPTYKVTDPISGKTLRLTGSSPPTDEELEEIFSKYRTSTPSPTPAADTGPVTSPNFQPTGFSALDYLRSKAGDAMGGVQQSLGLFGKDVSGTGSALGELATGALKSIPQTVLGLGKGVRSGLGMGELTPQEEAAFDPQTWGVASTSPLQTAGNVAGDMAQMALGGAAKGVPTAVGMGGRALRGAVEAGAFTTAKTGDVGEGVQSAVFGGVATPAIEGAGRAMKAVAPHMVNTLLKLKDKDVSFGKNPAKAILTEDLGPVTKFDDLPAAISGAKQRIGSEIQAVMTKAETGAPVIDRNEVLVPIMDAAAKAAKGGNSPGSYIETIQRLEGQWPEKLTLTEAWEMKQAIGAATKWAPDLDPAINEAKSRAYQVLRRTIEDVIPEVKPLNERYASLLGAEYGASKKALQESREGLLTSGDWLPAALGGSITMNPMGALGGIMTQRVLRDPRVTVPTARGLNTGGGILSGSPEWLQRLLTSTYLNNAPQVPR